MKPHPEQYRLLDYLRLVLAGSVVLLHLGGQKLLFQPVPAFLGLSGFLVLQSYENSESWMHFAWKRFLRISPALCISFVLCTFVAGYAGLESSLVTYLTLGTVDLAKSTNGALWSLGWEELLYALLAVLFAMGAYRSKTAVWLCLLAGMVIPLLMVDWPHAGPAIRMARPLGAAFFTGNLCYLYRDRLPGLRWWGVAAVVVSLATPLFSLPSLPMLPVALLSFGLLSIGTGFGRDLPRIPDLSYSSYVYHLPLAALTGRWWLPALFGACWLSERYVERPALGLKNRLPLFICSRLRKSPAST